jgi:hypothetical protein
VGDVVVGYIMYSISQVIVQIGKDWMGTVLKDIMPNGMLRHRLDGFIGIMLCVMEYCFCILTAGMISAVCRVDILCRTCDGEICYVKFT